MAVRTYIPGIMLVANYLKKYLAKHSAKLQQNMGEGLYSVLVLIVDLVVIMAEIISGNSDAEGDFQSPLATLSSAQINTVKGAYVKWLETNGIAGG